MDRIGPTRSPHRPTTGRPLRHVPVQLRLPLSKIEEGTRAFHKSFGYGEVVSIGSDRIPFVSTTRKGPRVYVPVDLLSGDVTAMRFADAIKSILEEQGRSQRSLAIDLGLTPRASPRAPREPLSARREISLERLAWRSMLGC